MNSSSPMVRNRHCPDPNFAPPGQLCGGSSTARDDVFCSKRMSVIADNSGSIRNQFQILSILRVGHQGHFKNIKSIHRSYKNPCNIAVCVSVVCYNFVIDDRLTGTQVFKFRGRNNRSKCNLHFLCLIWKKLEKG